MCQVAQYLAFSIGVGIVWYVIRFNHAVSAEQIFRYNIGIPALNSTKYHTTFLGKNSRPCPIFLLSTGLAILGIQRIIGVLKIHPVK